MIDVYGDILNNSNITNILEYYGLQINKNKCVCPFHHDTHPSMSIEPNKGIAKCFSCGAGGNAISFIQKYENEINHNSVNVRDAMQKAIDIQNLNIVIPSARDTLTKEQKELQEKTKILKDAITLTENNLRMNNDECKKSLEYLKNRNLSDEIIKEFHIGYDSSQNNILDELLKKYNINELMNLGLAKEYNNWASDVFKSRITIPIFDENGNPVGFGGRTLNDNIKPKYLNTKANEFFNKSKLLFNFHKAKSYARNDEIIIVEGYMDVISAKAMKMDNVVGTMGTALTKEHINMLKKLDCEVTLCLDNDEAGRDAMIRTIPELLKAKIKVNVLDISELGNFKDFGDLQMSNMTREKIYQTKISAFTFLMKYKYLKNNEITVESIHNIHNKMWKDGIIRDTKDVFNFKEYIMKNSKYTSEEIDKIIKPKEVTIDTRVDRYKDVFFYQYIIGLIKNYATKHNDSILLKYIESGKITSNMLVNSLNNEKYLLDNELTINIGSYIREVILTSDDYISFKNDKSLILENLLNNVKSFDSNGNVVDIELTIEQKKLVLKQYQKSFDENIRVQIENSPDEFEEIFIANSNAQFEKLFPKSYKEVYKEQAISNFKNNGTMEAIRYALAYKEEMKSVMSRQFVNNDKYKTLLVFNNNKNILQLSPENIKKTNNTKEKELEEPEKQIERSEQKAKNPMSIFIKLSGNEKETPKGMYLPIDDGKAVYIPKQLYNKSNSQVELMDSHSNKAIMSEYEVDNANNTKKWVSRLSLEEFYHKYFNLYEIKMEKEVMA